MNYSVAIIVCCFCAVLNSEPSRNQAPRHTKVNIIAGMMKKNVVIIQQPWHHQNNR